MTYKVLVRNHPTNGYKATTLAFPECEVEAPTREAALAGIREAIMDVLAQGEIVEVEIPIDQPIIAASYTDTFGLLRGDPTFDDFLQEVKQYREARNQVEEA